MSTSGVYNFTVTKYDIIRQAMLNIRRLDPVEAPTADEIQDCSLLLNMMCKQWMSKIDFAPGLKVWTRKRGHRLLNYTSGAYTVGPTVQGWANNMAGSPSTATIAPAGTTVTVTNAAGFVAGYTLAIQLDANTIAYATISTVVGTTITFSPGVPSQASSGNMLFCYQTTAQNPQLIETAVLRDDNNDDSPLRLLTVQDYDYLPNKADPTYQGDPTAIYFERGLTTSIIYTDVGAAQDLSKRLVVTYLEPVQDMIANGDEPYYPQEWYLALCWGLSEQIAPMFHAQWDQKMEQLKNSAIIIARQGDAERSSLFFQPGAED